MAELKPSFGDKQRVDVQNTDNDLVKLVEDLNNVKEGDKAKILKVEFISLDTIGFIAAIACLLGAVFLIV